MAANDRLVILKHFKLNGIQNKGKSLIVNNDQHQNEANLSILQCVI